MTREEFEAQSDELFFQVRNRFVDEVKKAIDPLFEKASQGSGTVSAIEVTQIMSTLCFEASCTYSEKLALLLFDQLFSQS